MKRSMENLNTYAALTDKELTEVDGGSVILFTIGGIAVTKGAAIAGGLFATGVGLGYFLG